MSLYKSLIRPIAFRLDPEVVHERALGLIAKGWFRVPLFTDPRLNQEFFGVSFPNPLGLAAGFDKNGVALDHWHKIGFGFVECGTVTRFGQPGNPKPRMFRLPEDHALINRLGFNNHGAEALAGQLTKSHPKVPVGINLGKTKATPIEEAAEDYRESFRLLREFGDYFVVNVSSPNTPGLRTLQEKKPLLEILQAMRSVDPARPLFVKVAPDLELPALDELIEVAVESNLTGIIATNTTLDRSGIKSDPGRQGGLSGTPLRPKSDAVLAHIYRTAPRSMVLIGVGGIMDAKDLYRKISIGAHLCQVYTGWVYGGPTMIPNVLRNFCAILDQEGVTSLEELRGCATTTRNERMVGGG